MLGTIILIIALVSAILAALNVNVKGLNMVGVSLTFYFAYLLLAA